jgi:hypothetical protein
MKFDVVQDAGSLAAVPGGRATQRSTSSHQHISIAGVVLLSAMAMVLTILGVLLLGAIVVAAWWLLSHIPVPHFIAALFTYIRLHV